jgi:hypothetical protein
MLLDVALAPRRLAAWRAVLAHSDRGRALRFHYVAIQDGPTYDPRRQALRLCYQCPDATIRQGRLVPVCLADRVSPLAGAPRRPLLPGLAQAVFAHMEGA